MPDGGSRKNSGRCSSLDGELLAATIGSLCLRVLVDSFTHQIWCVLYALKRHHVRVCFGDYFPFGLPGFLSRVRRPRRSNDFLKERSVGAIPLGRSFLGSNKFGFSSRKIAQHSETVGSAPAPVSKSLRKLAAYSVGVE